MAKRFMLVEGEEMLRREGLTPEPAPWEDGLRAATGPGTFEWWYFDAHFEDGSTVVIVYLTKPLLHRTDPLSPTVQLTITRPDGTRLRNFPPFTLYHPDEFAAATDQCDVHIGPHRVRGDLHRYELHAEGQGFAADLVFTGEAPPWRPGGGKTYYGEALTDYFAWLPSIPHGRAEGTLTYDGETRPVVGTGYHDHNWGNIDLNKVMSHWYWGRAHVGEYSLVAAEITHTPAFGGEKLPFFMLARGDRLITGDGRLLTLQTSGEMAHPSGKTYPTNLDFHWQGPKGTIDLSLRQPEIIEATSLLLYLPAWKRALARLLANPYYFRFNAALNFTADLDDLHASEHGSALYELMILH